MRTAFVLALVCSLCAGTAWADDEVPSTRLVVPALPEAMDAAARQVLEELLDRGRSIVGLAPIGGRLRVPCGLVVRSGGREVMRASLRWRGSRLIERVQWEGLDRPNGAEPYWRRTAIDWRDGLVARELGLTMQYSGGQADCPNSSRRAFSRDARGRIVSVRSTVQTCEGVDSGTVVYRHVWRHRAGMEEAVVRARRVSDDPRPADLGLHVLVPSERDAWAEYGQGAFPTWVELRDEQGFLRVRIESSEAGGVGEYAYACDGAPWPRGSSAPETYEPARSD